MGMNDGMYSSDCSDWGTPQYIYDTLNEKFNFTLDVCAVEWNKKHDNYFSLEDDGLSKEWDGVCFMNPPYGRGIKDWIKKAHVESIEGRCTVVALLPARTDTSYWHDYIIKYNREVIFIRGRLKFENQNNKNNSAPFPSAIVIFKKGVKGFKEFLDLPFTDTGFYICEICFNFHKKGTKCDEEFMGVEDNKKEAN